MKKIIILLTIIIFSINSAYSQVINAELEDIIKIGIEKNQDLRIKRLELEAANKDIKVANKLKNPQIQSNVVMGNVALGNSSQAGIAIPIEIAKRSERKRAATKAYEVKETELKQFEHSFKLQIMKAYFDILYAALIVKINEVNVMPVNYKKLWILLIEKHITKVQLRKSAKLSPATLTKLNKNEYVSMEILTRICGVLRCDIGDIVEVELPEDKHD